MPLSEGPREIDEDKMHAFFKENPGARDAFANLVQYPPCKFDAHQRFKLPEILAYLKERNAGMETGFRELVEMFKPDQETAEAIWETLILIDGAISQASLNMQLEAANKFKPGNFDESKLQGASQMRRIFELTGSMPYWMHGRGIPQRDQLDNEYGPFMAGTIAEEVRNLVEGLLENGQVDRFGPDGSYDTGEPATLDNLLENPDWISGILKDEAIASDEYYGGN
ncbi:MAG: hypothetical protein UT33_C0008G0002 [Candidatus Peregrinibacteria bacterium GW2011_GWC2_39_14]|nr:MAG: hypothetical protein US92_C0004G0002 [Candidatus Peregrinibacteria bacterium GW2011_GWA2_38_36]KKR06686.1 MAG: hypothetical protein UT33_C0008G0002 [Candidatus Peregrinibacteria bacterium GW2011_GWC2_39_14]